MIRYYPSGDSAFLLRFGSVISEEIHSKVQSYVEALQNCSIYGVLEVVPAYCDVTVHYNPIQISYQTLLAKLKSIETKLHETYVVKRDLIKIPVCYDYKFALDMNAVIEYTCLTKQDVIRKHTEPEYLVYMLGFTPGFCYLGGMDEQIATPRKDEPRKCIEAGAVGIAGNQTGIYPLESPGGWQIIGKTPLKLFNTKKENPFLFKAGDRLQFYSITLDDFEQMEEL